MFCSVDLETEINGIIHIELVSCTNYACVSLRDLLLLGMFKCTLRCFKFDDVQYQLLEGKSIKHGNPRSIV